MSLSGRDGDLFLLKHKVAFVQNGSYRRVHPFPFQTPLCWDVLGYSFSSSKGLQTQVTPVPTKLREVSKELPLLLGDKAPRPQK